MNEETYWRVLAAVQGNNAGNVKAILEEQAVEDVSEYDINADNGYILREAAGNAHSDALSIVKLLIEYGADIHQHGPYGETALMVSIFRKQSETAEHLLFRDDFLLSDLIPKLKRIPEDTYVSYREKAILHINGLMEQKGISYARVIAADIGKLLKAPFSLPDRNEVAVLETLAKKIASRDWVADAQVMSDNDWRNIDERQSESSEIDKRRHRNAAFARKENLVEGLCS